MSINFGEIIKNLRIKTGSSQRIMAAALDCTVVQISRMENNKTGISSDKLIELSYVLKFNFVKLEKHTTRFKRYLDYEAYFSLDKAMSSANIETIKSTLDYFNIVENFDYDETEIFKFYALAVIHAYSDVEKSMKYALQGLKINEFSFENINFILEDSLIEDASIAILSVISKNLLSLNRNDDAFKLSKVLYEYYNNIPFSKNNRFLRQTFFLKRQYIVAINNYAHMNKLLKNYNFSIELCDFAIEKCNEFNILNLLRFIYALKMENYYLLNDIKKAKECYNFIYVFSTTNNRKDYFDKLTSEIKESCPEI